MDTPDIQPLIAELTEDIDELEDALAPLLRAPLTSAASKLPLLDKAKLYVLHTYAIESIIFSHLRLTGVDAKSHPVFKELARVRQYFEKVKVAEATPPGRKMELDRSAAARFVRHALAGNEKYDRERGVQLQKQKAASHVKFEELSKRLEEPKGEDTHGQKRKADATPESEDSSDDSSDSSSDSDSESDSSEANENEEPIRTKQEVKPAAKRQKTVSPEGSVAPKSMKPEGKEDKTKSPGKHRAEQKAEARSRKQKSSHPPRAPSAAFQALLKGPLPKR